MCSHSGDLLELVPAWGVISRGGNGWYVGDTQTDRGTCPCFVLSWSHTQSCQELSCLMSYGGNVGWGFELPDEGQSCLMRSWAAWRGLNCLVRTEVPGNGWAVCWGWGFTSCELSCLMRAELPGESWVAWRGRGAAWWGLSCLMRAELPGEGWVAWWELSCLVRADLPGEGLSWPVLKLLKTFWKVTLKRRAFLSDCWWLFQRAF